MSYPPTIHHIQTSAFHKFAVVIWIVYSTNIKHYA